MKGIRRATATLIVVAVLVPTAALAFSAWQAFGVRAVQQKSGDAFLDAFREAEAQRNPSLEERNSVSATCLSLPDSQFEEWEATFGSDPRFWMLRQYLSENAGQQGLLTHGDWQRRMLQEAVDKGAADSAVWYAIWKHDSAAWRNEVLPEVSENPPGRKDDRTPYIRAVRRAVDAKFGTEQDEVLGQLKGSAPAEALPHYVAARVLAERGDYEAAIEEFRAGNMAPQNTSLIGFPYDWVLDEIDAQTGPQDRLLGAAIYLHCNTEVPLPNFISWKDSYRVALQEAVRREDWDGISVLRDFAVRYATQEHGSQIQFLVGLAMCGLLQKEVEASGMEISPARNKALRDLRVSLDNIKAEFKRFSSNRVSTLFGNKLPQPPSGIEQLELLFAGTGSMRVQVMLSELQDGETWAAVLKTKVQPAFNQLMSVNLD